MICTEILSLNQWMMVHPQVGPGADVTMTPFGVFPPQLQPYAQPFDPNHEPYATLSLGQQHQQYAPSNKVPQWAIDNANGNDRNVPTNGLGLASLVDAGLGAQIGGQTQLYWDNLIDGELYTLGACCDADCLGIVTDPFDRVDEY
jgi:hypothetical protein